MMPPKVEGAPKPTSSVRITSTFGAFSGAASVGGQAGVLSRALGMMVPWKAPCGTGSTREFGNSTALGAPGVPRNCCASAVVVMRLKPRVVTTTPVASAPKIRIGFPRKCPDCSDASAQPAATLSCVVRMLPSCNANPPARET